MKRRPLSLVAHPPKTIEELSHNLNDTILHCFDEVEDNIKERIDDLSKDFFESTDKSYKDLNETIKKFDERLRQQEVKIESFSTMTKIAKWLIPILIASSATGGAIKDVAKEAIKDVVSSPSEVPKN